MRRVVSNLAFLRATAWMFWSIALLALMLPLVAPTAAHGSIGNVSVFESVDDSTRLSGPLRPVEMVGARNGWASGQVLLISDRPQSAVRVEPGPLVGPGGARIAADRVWVRYGWNREPHRIEGDSRTLDEYIILAEAPPPSFTRLPIWFTVRIPADAAPGQYEGPVEIHSGNQRHTVTVQLRVGSFILPDRKAYNSLNNITYSPDSIALRYGVEPWSDEHLRLVRPTMRWLAEAGQRVFYVTFAERTQFGTRTPLVRFTRRGDNLVPDYVPLRRFAAQWNEVIGAPRAAVLYLWDIDMRRATVGDEVDTISVEVVSRDGTREFVAIPHISTPEGDRFWKPVVDEVIKILTDLGWSRDSIFIGVAHDRKPTERFTQATARLFPGMEWNVISHQRGYGLPRRPEPRPGLVIGFQEQPHIPVGYPNVTESGIRGDWNQPFIRLTLGRGFSSELIEYFMLSESSSSVGGRGGNRGRTEGSQGISRMWGDSFRVPPDMRRLVHRSGWVNLLRNTRHTLAPGPDGALAKVKYQMFVEGVQATEARLAIERILVGEQKSARIPAELERQARQALQWRINFEREQRSGSWTRFDEAEVRDELHKLYDAAGRLIEVSGVNGR
ncbi:MAG: hypothetical protein JJU36_07560 [Phycisphaeraceae bacterium]|nr:hypothetical protein [Phycisphaeraceae bacterium]